MQWAPSGVIVRVSLCFLLYYCCVNICRDYTSKSLASWGPGIFALYVNKLTAFSISLSQIYQMLIRFVETQNCDKPCSI